MDMLYEEAPATKVKGARHILKLALEPQYMEWLVTAGALIDGKTHRARFPACTTRSQM